jgi:hypothetical protein
MSCDEHGGCICVDALFVTNLVVILQPLAMANHFVELHPHELHQLSLFHNGNIFDVQWSNQM